MGYWSPSLLSASAAILAIVSVLPMLVQGWGLRRWAQTATLAAWALWAGAVLVTVSCSSPWVGVGAVVWGRRRLAHRVEGEAVEFMQCLVTAMAGGDSLAQTIRSVAQDPDLGRAYARPIAQAQEVVALVEAGAPLSQAAIQVSESLDAMSKRVWDQIALIAHLAETATEMTISIQRIALQQAWATLFEIDNEDRLMKQELMQVNLAKWVFTLIIPGVNILMAMSLKDYKFLESPIGWGVLAIQVTALAFIHFVFSFAQNLPEVRA